MLKAVPFSQVQIKDSFWAPRQKTNREVTVPHCLDMVEQVKNIYAFELAAAGGHETYPGLVFSDSDVYKSLEAAAYVLATDPDPALDKRVDDFIAKMTAAQMPDGYLNTYYQITAPEKRWTNLRDHHEIYTAGHLFEAAVAHYQATGKRNLLDVAIRLADHIDSIFGDGPGKRIGYCGHPEAELALVKLWRATREDRYFSLARFFVERRGSKVFAEEHGTPLSEYDGTYLQDNVPIREHQTIDGHAVRAAYLFAGVLDVAAETHDQGLLDMVDRVWHNAVEKRMFITGGIGNSRHNEGFTTDYDLPNLTAYQETCAAIAMALWNHRLNLLYADARYADIVELNLYNAILAGISLDGKKFFYENHLASDGNHHRQEWFECACCPPNVSRILGSLAGYAYAVSKDGVWVNLYIKGTATMKVGKKEIALEVTTDYPWDGIVKIAPQIAAPARFTVYLRVPGWCTNASLKVNRRRVTQPTIERGYIVLQRIWRPGDVVELNLPMPVRRVEAHPLVEQDVGQIALQRGPLVYCLEACDQSVPVPDIALPLDAELKPEKKTDILGGVVVLQGMGEVVGDGDWTGKLYRTAVPPQQVPITAIPYYAWDNRGAGPMKVWLPLTPPPLGGGS